MAGNITGVADTFGLPNYQGQLFGLTPYDTPLLSAIGGLTGGRQTESTQLEWQTYDLRDPSAGRARLEGATAPTAEARVRGVVRNVVEVHQEVVAVSYTKQAAMKMYRSPTADPFSTADDDGQENPVTDEMSFQLEQAIKGIALDVNYTFWNGRFQNPTTNASPRKTRGILQAITTNVVDKSTSVITGLSSSASAVAETSTGLANTNKIVFTNTGDMTNVTAGKIYYVVGKTTDAFGVSSTSGGTAIVLGTSTSNVSYRVPYATALASTTFEDAVQLAYDNGGLTENSTATICCNSTQKRALTKAYASAYLQADPMAGTRNVGGLALETIYTDFGRFNILLDRHIPRDTIAILSLEQFAPVFLAVPDKGIFFAEPLAKTGASDQVQLYGEIGLQYGAETAHAIIRGLKV